VEFQELTLHACFNSHAAIERIHKSKINDPLHQNPQGITGANCTNRKHQTSSNLLKEMDCLSFALEIKPTGIWTSENTASPQETVRTLASALLSLTVITRTISDIHRHFQSLWEILCADAKPLITSAGLHRSR
jgi:hypothetical protein